MSPRAAADVTAYLMMLASVTFGMFRMYGCCTDCIARMAAVYDPIGSNGERYVPSAPPESCLALVVFGYGRTLGVVGS